jgi:Glycosyl hydrolases family 38 N-terminal domain/Alpha mannosidase middle domain
VLDELEADERMRFTLDGQLATVDDYVQIRPESEERIRASVREGRLAIGPWQTLVDEFLVSGETICRNLEVGLARAEQLGGAMRIGYLPDSFGHIAQMPQILQNAGIEAAVVWRGVPASVESHSFAWEAPDGSVVRAEYLPENGYSNAAYIFDRDTLGEVVGRLRPWFGDDPILGMVGTDHMPVAANFAARVPSEARIATLGDYISDTALQQTVTRVVGELRSASRANLLPNVVSARIDLKQACGAAERALERYAEPLQALYGGEWPGRFLDIAWSRLLQNAAHDSICGCSADEVSAQVLVRYAEARQIGEELTRRALERIGARAPAGTTVVVNPSAFERTEVVDIDGEPALVTVPPLGYTTSRSDVTDLNLLDADFGALTKIVRGRDVGDSYNYAPPDDDVLVDEPEEESLETVEDGPLRRIVDLRRTYRWDDRLVQTATRFETRAGESFVRVRISFGNPCENQRVRVHVALPHEAHSTRAEGQFAIVERPPLQEAGHGELGLGVYPASSFVTAGGISLLFVHVSEYELVSPRELAITVLRSIGLISRAANPWRRENAGPELPIPAAQMHGPHTFSFAWCPSPEDAVKHAERYRHPLLTTPGTGAADARREQVGPALEGAVLSSLRRREGALEARVVNESDAPSDASFGDTTFELRPWEIRTVRLAWTSANAATTP